jgi:glycosyltransferase involved in cell wall biosynthesis
VILLVPDLRLEAWHSMDRYAAELARRLPEIAVAEEARTLGGPRYYARYVRYPRALRRYQPELVHIADHSYAHCLKSFPGAKSVVTVHDLYPVAVLEARQKSVRAAVRDRLLRWVLDWAHRASRWIAGSAFAAAECRRLLGVPEGQMKVIPYGVAEAFFRRPTEVAIAARRQAWLSAARSRSNRHVILHVGTCAPRKNVEAATAALGVLRRRGVDACLVQIGGEFKGGHRAAMAAAGVEDVVVQERMVDEASLLSAYYAADVLVMPSTYEGFGLPVLEALAAGLPVVTSGAGGLREAGGDAAVVADGANPPALADALELVLLDTEVRSSLRERGIAHARTHTWERTAELTRVLYREALGGS